MPLATSLSVEDLAAYTSAQLDQLYPDKRHTLTSIQAILPTALERLEYSFDRIHSKYYHRDGHSSFSHLMGDQYAACLYFLSREASQTAQNPELAAKIYSLNKALHAIDVYYEVELPEIFCFQHTVGTVLGRASYQDYLFVHQRVTVGGNLDLTYPKIGKGVALFGGVSIVGDSTIGDNVFVSINTTCNGENIPPNSVAYGATPNLLIKPNQRDVIATMFHKTPAPKSQGAIDG